MFELCDTGETLKENPWRDNPHIDAITDAINDLPPVTPQPETYTNIPLLLHKEFGCPLDECVKAYEEAIEHLRSKSKLKG